MLTLVLLKIAADLALYYAFAATLASLLGAAGGLFLPAMAIQVIAFTLSYATSRKGRLRYLPLVLCALAWLLPGLGWAGTAVLVPPTAYLVLLAHREIYAPSRPQQERIFSASWKAFLALLLVCLLTYLLEIFSLEQTVSIALPFALLSLGCSVLLLRSLRHEAHIYCRFGYQLLNLLLVGAVYACALLLSSGLFQDACMALLRAFYRWVIRPLLMGLSLFVSLLLKLFSGRDEFLESIEHQSPSPTPTPPEPSIPAFPETPPAPPAETFWVLYVLAALGILLALAAAGLLFWSLSRRRPSSAPGVSGEEHPERAEAPLRRTARPGTLSSAARVRAQYRKFLKLLPARSLRPERCDTSLDICTKCSGKLNSAAAEELRALYIRARYQGTATREDARRARALYLTLKNTPK